MLVNKDHDHDHAVRIVFADPETKRDRYFKGAIERISLSGAEYQWHGDAPTGHPDPDGPASRTTIIGDSTVQYQIPKASIIVLRGKIVVQ